MNREKIDAPRWKPVRKEVAMYSLVSVLFVGQVILCFLSYNTDGLTWLSYFGWITLVVSLVLGMVSRRTFEKKGGAPDKKDWLRTTVVVKTGIYRIVRHPMYLSFMLTSAALLFISQHWLSILFGIPVIAFLYYTMAAEEKINIKEFGNDYIQYMQKVPRMNFVRGLIQRKKD